MPLVGIPALIEINSPGMVLKRGVIPSNLYFKRIILPTVFRTDHGERGGGGSRGPVRRILHNPGER